MVTEAEMDEYKVKCKKIKEMLMPYVLNNKSCGISKQEIPDVVVSLSCHPNYWKKANIAIESMMIQTVKPNQIVLYLSDKLNQDEVLDYYSSWIARGLTVKFREDIGPATKYWYALREYSESIVLTIDADRIYFGNMIEYYLMTYLKSDRKSICAAINIYAHKVYSFYNKTGRDVLYPEGFAGVLYPPHIFDDEFFNFEVFNKYTRNNDDIWTYVNILRLGINVISVVNNPDAFQVQNWEDDIITNNISNTTNTNIDVGWNIPFANLIEYYGINKYYGNTCK